MLALLACVSVLALSSQIIHSPHPANQQLGLDGIASYEVPAVTSTDSPKEIEISRYRHGCDPPKSHLSVSPFSALSDCRHASTSQQFFTRLIKLQPSLLPLVFRFHKNQARRIGVSRILGHVSGRHIHAERETEETDARTETHHNTQ